MVATLLLLALAASSPRPARADAVVGTGTADSCTEAALDRALGCHKIDSSASSCDRGGSVTFNCGSSPVTIFIGQKAILGSVRIEGGGLITLSGAQLLVDPRATLALANLNISHAAVAVGFGGAVDNYGTSNVANCTFAENSAGGDFGGGVFYLGYGGAIANGPGANLTVTNSTFFANSATGAGGAIYTSAGTVTVSNSTFDGNSGGAIGNDSGTVTVSNCTFFHNSGGAINNGGNGGATNIAPGTVTVTNSTFFDNSFDFNGSPGSGSVIANFGGTLALRNSILADSDSYFLPIPICLGPVIDGGHNLDSGTSCGFSVANHSSSRTQPLLNAGLANNGGPTQTIALWAGSSAINAGDQSICAAAPVSNLDQRGFVRPGTGNASCSIGAFEYSSPGLPDCCQCPASCAAPVNGSCGGCTAVFGATCESGSLCVLNPPTATPTVTPTPTITATRTSTPAATITPTNTPTPSLTPTATNTPGAHDCCQCADLCAGPIVGTCGGCAVVFAASCTGGSSCVPRPPPPSATASVTRAATATSTPPTNPPRPTVTATATNSPTGLMPTPTPPPLPPIPFLFAQNSNQYLCAFNLAFNPPLTLAGGTETFIRLKDEDPAHLRSLYQVVYVAPDLSDADYALLRQMVASGGLIEQFVKLGGVAVFNVSGSLGDQLNIAPDGVGFSGAAQHVSEQILTPLHPYITGAGFGGEVLGTSDFANWQPTDYGTLTGLPLNASVLLANNDGPSLAEYQYGDGRVIVSTLAYCWDGKPASQGAAARNLLRYSRFLAPTPSATVTGTRPIPTPTPTPLPAIPFLFAQGSNQYLCAFNLAFNPPLMLAGGTETFIRLKDEDPAHLRSLYQVVYVAPDLGDADYTLLRQMVASGGLIEQFVSMGGVAVLNVAGSAGDQVNVAPDNVGFSGAAQHVSEQILTPLHPYITGVGFGGEPLDASSFANWQPTDYGTLTNLPGKAAVLLADKDGPSLAEYQHGAGRVIVSTLAYCWDGKPNSQGAAARNLLRYSRFFVGSALTPTPTVMASGTPTKTATQTNIPTQTPTATPPSTATATMTNTPNQVPTSTATASPTKTATQTPTVTPVATITRTPTRTVPPTSAPGLCVGDCGGDHQVTVNEILTMVNIALGNAQPSACPKGVPGGAQVDVALIIRALNNALNGCSG